MGRINDSNYIQVSGWMRNELNLKGNELLVYALIHGFSQDGKSVFSGGLAYIGEWISGTDHTVVSTLKSLIEKGLIAKRVTQTKGSVKYVEYWTVRSRGKPSATTANSTVAENHHCKNYSRTTANSTVVTTANFAVNNTNINSSLKNSSSPSLSENSTPQKQSEKREEEKESVIRKVIQDIFGNENALTDDFEEKLRVLFSRNGIEEGLFDQYLRYVWNLCEQKKPDNMSAYFFRSALNDMTAMNFMLREKNAAREEKEELYTCPVCGHEHGFFEDCPHCGLKLHERNDTELCEIKKKEILLPENERNALSNELLELCKKYLGDSSPDRFQRQNAEKLVLYKKYGLIADESERNLALFKDGA